jgi:seryl-tRNA synthetase
MIDQQLLRKDIHLIAQRLATRGFNLDQTAYNLLENSRKQLQARTEELQARRNQISKAIGHAHMMR